MVLPLLAKMILPKVIKKVTGKAAAAAGVTVPTKSSRPMPVIVLMVLSTLIMIPALVLVFLCLFAGYKPDMMDGYPVYTVNVSRIGENILTSIDQQISSGNLTKRETADVPAVIASPRASLVARANDQDDDETTTMSKKTTMTVHSTTTLPKPTSTLTTSTSAKTTSTSSPSKTSGVSGAAQTAVVKQVNKAFGSVIDRMDLYDFYDFHVLSQCYGSYVSKNGSQAANTTTGNGPLPNRPKTDKRVEGCKVKSSALTLTAITYGFGVACTSTAFFASIWAIIAFTKKPVLIAVASTSVAFLVQLLSSAAAHAIANSASGLVDFIGNPVGIDGRAGKSFLALTWACTVLLGLVAGIWGLLFFFGRKQPAFHGLPPPRPVSVSYELKGFPYSNSEAQIAEPRPAPTRPPRPSTPAQWI